MEKSKIARALVIVVLSVIYVYFGYTSLVESIVIGISVYIGMEMYGKLFKKYMQVLTTRYGSKYNQMWHKISDIRLQLKKIYEKENV